MESEQLISAATARQVVYAATVFELLFSCSFFITALVASNSCFLTSNEDGKCVNNPVGVEELYGFYGGNAFELVISAMLYIAFGACVMRLLRNPEGMTSSSSFNVGTLFGFSIYATISALFEAAKWGSTTTMLGNIDCDELSQPFCPKDNGAASYTGLCVLSSFLFLVNLLISCGLYFYREEFMSQFEPEHHGYVAQTDNPLESYSSAEQQNQQEDYDIQDI